MRVVLVTGSSSGFGLLTAVELARRGDRVFASMRDPSRAGALRSALEDAGAEIAARVEVVQLDVLDEASIRAAVAHVEDVAGGIDVVVNNAGVASGSAVEELTAESLSSVFDTNVFGTLRVIQAVLPAMRARGAGHVVNVTSMAAFLAPPFMGAYAASKHAVDALGEALAAEVAPFGIHVTNVAPGAYDTPMIAGVDDVRNAIEPSSPYAERLRTMLDRHAAMMRQSDDPGEVATAIADAVDADPPPARVVVPASSAGMVAARGSMPPEKLRGLLAKSYGV
ncbi:MAG TPA: SDR family oxidoreductase [Acidimicrobiales bacterium]|nr:SDR family oxidoreductase [Acidimicrobiales bacterium]